MAALTVLVCPASAGIVAKNAFPLTEGMTDTPDVKLVIHSSPQRLSVPMGSLAVPETKSVLVAAVLAATRRLPEPRV
jgi:hypothetical protein